MARWRRQTVITRTDSEVAAQPRQVVKIARVHDVAARGGRRHHDRVDDRHSRDRSERLAGHLGKVDMTLLRCHSTPELMMRNTAAMVVLSSGPCEFAAFWLCPGLLRAPGAGLVAPGPAGTIAAYAKAQKLPAPSFYVESESAIHEKNERRERIRTLMADVRPGDLVVCDKIDRWSRDPEFTYR